MRMTFEIGDKFVAVEILDLLPDAVPDDDLVLTAEDETITLPMGFQPPSGVLDDPNAPEDEEWADDEDDEEAEADTRGGEGS